MMQQIMAAVQSASQLEVADLIQDRVADGSLPTPVSTNEPSLDHNAAGDAAAAAAAAAMVPSSSKRKAVGRDRDATEEAEGSQMRNAKRPRVEQAQGEQPQEAQDGQAGPSALNRGKASLVADPPTAADGADSNPRHHAVGIPLPDQAVGTGPLPAGLDTAGGSHTETAAAAGASGHVGCSSTATLDQLRQSHGRKLGQAGSGANLMADQSQIHDPQALNTALARDDAAGTTGDDAGQEQARAAASFDQHARHHPQASSAMPDEDTLQSAQVGPSTHAQPGQSTQAQPGSSTQTQMGPSTQAQTGSSTQNQPGPSTQAQLGPTTGAPDLEMQEDADPEMKEKREQARSRSRAWRKVLLDGLDLQIELTVTAAQALHPDSALAEAELKVGPSCLHHLMCVCVCVCVCVYVCVCVCLCDQS